MNSQRHNRSCVAGNACLYCCTGGSVTSQRFFLMILCFHFRSQWGSQTKPTKSAHVLQRNYANEGKTKKRTLSWRSIPLSPRLKTHSFVKYLTHLCLSFELRDLQSTSYQLVWEKCPPLMLAQTTWHIYRRTDRCIHVHMSTDSPIMCSELPLWWQLFVYYRCFLL